MSPVIQKIEKNYGSGFEIAKKYYSILFELNNLKVTKKETLFVSFLAIKGTISTPPVREEFIKEFNISKQSVYNMTAKLQKLKILLKDNKNKVRVNPQILPDFSNEQFLFIIKLNKI